MSRRVLLLIGIAAFAVIDGLLLYYIIGVKLTNAQPTDDLAIFLNAARRIIESGTPYLPLHLDPSLVLRPGWEVVDAYVYPPLIAQLLVPLAGLDHTTAWNSYSAVSVAAMLLAGLIAARVASVRLSPLAVIFGVLLILPAITVTSALWHGRPEPLIALAVAIALASGGAASGAAVAVAALLRLPTAAFGLPLLIGGPWRQVLIGGVTTAVILIVGGALFAPQAWGDYLFGGAAVRTLVGNIGIGLYDDAPHALVAFVLFQALDVPVTANAVVDLAAIGPRAEIAIRGVRLLEIVVAVALFVWSIGIARDPRRRHAAIAVSFIGGLLLSGLVWEYHALPLLPVAIVALLRGGPGVRRLLLAAYVLGLLPPIAFNAEVLGVDLPDGDLRPALGLIRRAFGALSSVGVIVLIVEAARRSRLPVASPTTQRHPANDNP